MRLLLVHNSYQQRGGEDQVFASEVDLLSSHGHQVERYLAHNDSIDQLSKPELAIKTIWNWTTYRDLRVLIRRARPELVHVHNALPLISPAIYHAAGAEHVPVVQTLHNYRLLCPQALLLRQQRICEDCVGRSLPWPGILHACYRGSRSATTAVAVMLSVHRVLGTWTRKVSRYIALTEFMRHKFIAGGLPANRIAVKPNFVRLDPGMGDHRGGFAVFVGRLSAEKGIHTLLRAWKLLGNRLPLKIAGEGPLRGLADGAPSGVEWLGRMPHDEILRLMKRASVLVVPSECYEGFPITIAEGFATGLPVVASRLGAMAEIVQDNLTGRLFSPGDHLDLVAKIEWLLGRPYDATEMGRLAREEYQAKYTAERNYELMLGIYEQTLNAPFSLKSDPVSRSAFCHAATQ